MTITAAMMVSMMPRSDATYHDMGNDVWWMNVGDKIGVSIMGDPAGAPAFEGAVTAPSAVTIQTKIQGASISRNAPFTVTWTPGTGTTQFFFEYSTRLVTCEFPAEAGTGTVPVSALLYLSGPNAGLSIYVTERTRLQKLDWTLDVIARTPALIMGDPAYADLTLQ